MWTVGADGILSDYVGPVHNKEACTRERRSAGQRQKTHKADDQTVGLICEKICTQQTCSGTMTTLSRMNR